MKQKTRKSVHLYCIQKDCADGTCTIDVETFPKTEAGLNDAYRRMAELNKKKDIHYLRLIKV